MGNVYRRSIGLRINAEVLWTIIDVGINQYSPKNASVLVVGLVMLSKYNLYQSSQQ